MNLYRGTRGASGVTVTVQAPATEAVPLELRLDLINHSPDGFEWGYHGSGPSQLALAILARELGDDQAAMALHQEFKARVVAMLPEREWELTGDEVRGHAQALREVVERALAESVPPTISYVKEKDHADRPGPMAPLDPDFEVKP